jgi:hypothetical protein
LKRNEQYTMKQSPWGAVQSEKVLAEGITLITTASHGGIHLSRKHYLTVRLKFPDFSTFAGGPWYEEDCDVAVVMVCFPEAFSAETVARAKAAINADTKYFKHIVA